jgi:hypothetical protein
MIGKNITGLQDFSNCRQAKAIRDYQTRIFPKFPLWERIKLLFKKHKHKWKIFAEQEVSIMRTYFGKNVGKSIVFHKAYKCSECGEFKFWYSKDMEDECLKRSKERFEFEVLNNIN